MDGWMDVEKKKKRVEATKKKIKIQATHLEEILFELLGTRGK